MFLTYFETQRSSGGARYIVSRCPFLFSPTSLLHPAPVKPFPAMFPRVFLSLAFLHVTFQTTWGLSTVPGPDVHRVVDLPGVVDAVHGPNVDVSYGGVTTVTNILQLAGGAIHDGVGVVDNFFHNMFTPSRLPTDLPDIAFDPIALVLMHPGKIPSLYKHGDQIDESLKDRTAQVFGIPVDLSHVWWLEYEYRTCDAEFIHRVLDIDASDTTYTGPQDIHDGTDRFQAIDFNVDIASLNATTPIGLTEHASVVIQLIDAKMRAASVHTLPSESAVRSFDVACVRISTFEVLSSGTCH